MLTKLFRKDVLAIAMATFFMLGAHNASSESDVKPSATLKIDQTEVAFLLSGKLGGGTLSYQGKEHRFSIGGLGVGGIGISKVEATGQVFHLNALSDFEGAYGQARSGIVVSGIGEIEGGIWLRNPSGVVIYLQPEREGIMLSLGADAILIDLD